MSRETAASGPATTHPGMGIVRADAAFTAMFAVTATAAVIRPSWFQWPALIVSLALFSAGCVVMWIAFLTAVGRSRHEVIGIGGLYFGAGSAPNWIGWRLNGLLALQLVVGIATASIRPFTAAAFGTLAPIFGIAMTGLWCARHGQFAAKNRGGES